MSRLVVVSNRVADLANARQSGGLAVALSDALGQRGGIWFGWDGKVVARGTRVPPTIHKQSRVTSITLPLTRKDYDEYYLGFSNSLLWPIFHYRLDLAEFRPAYLRGYKRANSKFADALAPLLKPDDVIWVHDYHLIPLATELRKRGFGQRIGFFLHIPFPPPSIFVAAPEHDWLVRCLFSYDLVGFQTRTDVGNFEQYVHEHHEADSFNGFLKAYGRKISVGHFPIGIDAQEFYEVAHTRKADEEIKLLNRAATARSHIIGVDRLDYSKGLPERLRAFARLLEIYPQNNKAVTLMQIAPPTREDVEAYSDIREELESLTGAINGEFGDYDWTPLRYLHRNVSRDTLAALFRGSEVGLVTPLRDGMNLVAKEYVAAQDAKNPGVLILSKFAGAAEDLIEALIVNPYNVDEVAQAMQFALSMPLKERKKRHAALLKRVMHNDARRWQETFLAALDEAELGAAA